MYRHENTLSLLGCRAALVVHGSGIDEIALHGPTTAAVLRDGFVETIQIVPEDVGLERRPIEALKGGDRDVNAAWLKNILAGHGTPVHNEAVALNAGALLWLVGRAPDLQRGYEEALGILLQGGAADRLAEWVDLSHGR